MIAKFFSFMDGFGNKHTFLKNNLLNENINNKI